MKTRLLACALAVLSAAAPAFAVERWAYESPTEFFTVGDFDGDTRDDLVVLDKPTGSFRVALQSSADVYVWMSPASAGFSNITSLASGRLLSTSRDALGVVTPYANRVQLLSIASSTAPWLPWERHLTNTGPATLTAIDIGGAGNDPLMDDVYLGSTWNGSLANWQTTLRNSGSAFTGLAAGIISGPAARANAVRMKDAQPLHSAVVLRGTVNDTLLVSSNNAGSLLPAASLTFLAGSDFLAGKLETASNLWRFVHWKAGVSNLVRVPVNEVAGGYAFGSATTFPLDAAVGQVFLLPGTGSPRLLVIDAGGSAQSVYGYGGSTNPPSLLSRSNAAPGEVFTGGLALGGHGFMSFRGPPGSGRTTVMRPMRWSGSAYTNGAPVTLPSLDTFAGQGNVMVFKLEPFVAPEPLLLSSLNAGDWSSSPTLGGTVNAVRENYAGPAVGVTAPTAVGLGAVPAGGAFALANQRSNFMSLFSLTAPSGNVVSEVRIAPAAGVYDQSISVSLSTSDAAQQIWYRLNDAGAWRLYSAPFVVASNSTVLAYGRPATGTARSAVRSASYQIRTPQGTRDSDNDGVPDYVELAKGLNPLGGPDSDGDGWSDLEELVYGTNPLDAASKPATGSAPITLKSGFLLEARPQPRDYYEDKVVKSKIGTLVRLHSPAGAFLGEGAVALPAERAARFSNVVADVSMRLLSLATEPHFDIETTNVDTRIGPELLALVPVPKVMTLVVSNLYTGTNDSRDATNWLTAATLVATSSPPQSLSVEFQRFNTLAALLTERKVGDLLVLRSNAWATNLTLFPGRVGDFGRSNASLPTLLSVEQRMGDALPGYRLKTILETLDTNVATALLTGVSQLKTLVGEVFLINSQSNTPAPGVYPLPADVLREFIRSGVLHSNYAVAAALTGGQIANARLGVDNLLGSVPSRPVTNHLVRLRSTECSPGTTLVDEIVSGVPHVLLDAAGLPFTFPQTFALLAGSDMLVQAYTDAEPAPQVPSGCVTNPLEVISAVLLATPVASDPDTDGNLLIDSWERAFFGGRANAFADSDGDGYQDLQEMFEGTDPRDALNIPGVAAAVFERPRMRAVRLPNGLIAVRWTWPASYMDNLVFALRVSGSLTLPFSDVAVAATRNGDEFTVLIDPATLPSTGFYSLVVRLR